MHFCASPQTISGSPGWPWPPSCTRTACSRPSPLKPSRRNNSWRIYFQKVAAPLNTCLIVTSILTNYLLSVIFSDHSKFSRNIVCNHSNQYNRYKTFRWIFCQFNQSNFLLQILQCNANLADHSSSFRGYLDFYEPKVMMPIAIHRVITSD